MSKAAAWMRLAGVALVLLAILYARPECPTLYAGSQTASVSGVLAQEEYYSGYWEEGYDPSAIEEDWCPPDYYVEEPDVYYDEEVVYYPDEVWEYYDAPDYYDYVEVPTYYTSPSYQYVAPSVSHGQTLYTIVSPIGVASGPETTVGAPTVTTYTKPIQLSFDVVPLGVPTGGLTQTYLPPAEPNKPVPQPTPPAEPIVWTTTTVVPLPSCSLYATPYVIDGGNVVFHWSSVNAVAATLSGVGGVPTQSSYFPVSAPAGSRVYTLTVFDQVGRSAQCVATVSIASSPPITYEKPWCSILAIPNKIFSDESATLSWVADNSTGATLVGVGAVGTVGTYTVSPGATRTYSLTAYGPGGSASCATALTVVPRPAPTPKPAASKAPSCVLTADPASIFVGSTTTLRWSSSRADSASLTGAGSVKPSGSIAVAPTTSQKYVLSVKGEGGSASCSVEVKAQTHVSCTVICNGVTYACAPTETPVAVQCPTESGSSGGFWGWLKNLFY